MTLGYKPRLRHRRFDEYPRVNALPLIIPSTFREVKLSHVKTTKKRSDSGMKEQVRQKEEERKEVRFVRVDDRLFKVPHGFFLQMPLQMQQDTKFSEGLGLKPEKPIFLHRHSEDQFKQILSAYNAFPSLDVNSLTLDHILTVGELSLHYGLRNLVDWFYPTFRSLVLAHHSPLRTMQNNFYVRMMKLALQMKNIELLGVIQASWAKRIHSGRLSPIWALQFADLYGLRDLLGHACYAYLMCVHSKIEEGQCFNERRLLTPRQTLYILAGYHSLQSYWTLSGRHPPEFQADSECTLHTRCVQVWNQRWSTLLFRIKHSFPEVDVLNRLGLMLQHLTDDTILKICLSSSCRSFALDALTRRRDQVSHHLHHHFDI